MRGTILRVTPACVLALATGCFMLGNLHQDTAPPRTETHAYWRKTSEILARTPSTKDMKGMLRLVREQTVALRALPTEGVDAELTAAVQDVIKYEEEVLQRAEMADNNEEILRQSQAMAKLFAEANKKATESKRHLRALRDALNDRYEGGFSPMAGSRAGGNHSNAPNRRR